MFRDGTPDILAYPQTAPPMAGCASLLSLGKARAPKGECFLDLDDLLEYRDGLAADRHAARADAGKHARPLLSALGRDTWLAASMLYTGEDRRRLKALQRIGRAGAGAADRGQ